MIYLFYFNNEWILSTRSNIGATNKWNNKSFKQLFQECIPDLNYDLFNNDYTYSFVIQHKTNRHISNILINHIILTEVYKKENNELIYVPINQISLSIKGKILDAADKP